MVIYKYTNTHKCFKALIDSKVSTNKNSKEKQKTNICVVKT